MTMTRPRSVLEADPPTIIARYQCDTCGIRDREFKIPAREAGQDILWWMKNRATVALAADHFATSPGCRVTEMTWVKIPVGDGDLIGGIKRQ